MATIPQIFPSRPLRITLPGSRLRARLWNTLGALFLLGSVIAVAAWTVPALITDIAVRDTATTVRGRIEEGRCRSKLVFHLCDVTLRNAAARPPVTRDVTYLFIDLHFGDFTAQVMADPAHPDWVTTDLGLDQLVSRTITLGVLGVLTLIALIMGLRSFFRREARRGAINRISGKPLVPVQLTLLGGAATKTSTIWTLRNGAEAPLRWVFPAGVVPFMLGTEGRMLGVTGPDGGIAVPLDAGLAWLDLTEEERAAIRAAA